MTSGRARAGGSGGGSRDGAAAARFRRTLVIGGRYVGHAGARVPMDISDDGLFNGGFNLEKGANGVEK